MEGLGSGVGIITYSQCREDNGCYNFMQKFMGWMAKGVVETDGNQEIAMMV